MKDKTLTHTHTQVHKHTCISACTHIDTHTHTHTWTYLLIDAAVEVWCPKGEEEHWANRAGSCYLLQCVCVCVCMYVECLLCSCWFICPHSDLCPSGSIFASDNSHILTLIQTISTVWVCVCVVSCSHSHLELEALRRHCFKLVNSFKNGT